MRIKRIEEPFPCRFILAPIADFVLKESDILIVLNLINSRNSMTECTSEMDALRHRSIRVGRVSLEHQTAKVYCFKKSLNGYSKDSSVQTL